MAARAARKSASRPTPIAKGGYSLVGVSDLPDPDFHAFRKDLADVALAGRVIASHYAEPLLKHLAIPSPLRRCASADCEPGDELQAGDDFWLLDDTAGWAWGYGGKDRRVGYVPSVALGS